MWIKHMTFPVTRHCRANNVPIHPEEMIRGAYTIAPANRCTLDKNGVCPLWQPTIVTDVLHLLLLLLVSDNITISDAKSRNGQINSNRQAGRRVDVQEFPGMAR